MTKIADEHLEKILSNIDDSKKDFLKRIKDLVTILKAARIDYIKHAQDLLGRLLDDEQRERASIKAQAAITLLKEELEEIVKDLSSNSNKL